MQQETAEPTTAPIVSPVAPPSNKPTSLASSTEVPTYGKIISLPVSDDELFEVEISMSMAFPIPAEDNFDEFEYSMSVPESLSMVDADFGEDGVGDWWWTQEGSMPYLNRPMSLSLSIPDIVPPLEQDGTNYDAVESFSNDVDEYQYMWV